MKGTHILRHIFNHVLEQELYLLNIILKTSECLMQQSIMAVFRRVHQQRLAAGSAEHASWPAEEDCALQHRADDATCPETAADRRQEQKQNADSRDACDRGSGGEGDFQAKTFKRSKKMQAPAVQCAHRGPDELHLFQIFSAYFYLS